MTHRCIHFFVPSVQAYFLGSNYCIWKSSKSLKTRLSPSTNWFRLFCFHEDPALPKKEQYLLFWMEIQNLEGRTKCVNAEKRAHFHFQLHVLLSMYVPFPCTQHTYFYQYTSLSPLRSTRTSINIHLFPLYTSHVLLSIYIPFPSTQHTYFYQYASPSPLRSTRTSINIHPFPLYAAHFMKGFWSCIWCIFFSYLKNLGTINIPSLPHFLFFFCPFPPRKNSQLRHYYQIFKQMNKLYF